jgi:hypothetical protein
MAKIHGLGDEKRITLLGLAVSIFEPGLTASTSKCGGERVDLGTIENGPLLDRGDGCPTVGNFIALQDAIPAWLH